MSRAAVAASVFVALLAPAIAPATHIPAHTERQLAVALNRINRLEAQVERLTTSRANLRDRVGRQQDTINSQAATITALQGEVPERVAAVAAGDDIQALWDLVISPAHKAWLCGGTMFLGETFWSVDFDRRTSSGDCY